MNRSTRRSAAAAVLTALSLSVCAVARCETVVLAGYPGIFQENFVKAVVTPFMQTHPGITVEFHGMPNSAQILGTLRAQAGAAQIDVVIMDVSVAKAASAEGLLAAMDETVTQQLPDLYPQARVAGVNAAGLTFDNLVLLYNTDKVKPAPSSWNALWDARYAKQVSIPAVPDIQGTALTIIADKMAGGTDYVKSVDAGIARLGKLAPNVQTWDPRPDSYQPISGGTAAIGIGWNARAQVYADLSAGKLGVVLPQEGSVFQINVIGLVKDGPAGRSARKFIDYALGAQAQAAFATQMFYAPTNTKAAALIARSVMDRTAAAAMDRMIAVDWLEVARIRAAITEQWRRRVIPLSR